MDDLRFTRQKIVQIKKEIARVQTSDFHHPAVKRVLMDIDRKSDILSEDMDYNQNASLDIKQSVCMRVNRHIAHFHEAIGFILRSTNARNSFEIHDPLLRLSRGFLGPDATLVLSSEWEFVPFSTPSVFAGLPKCTFIGLPAMESANGLIVPLAGHELGHAVYQATAIYDELNDVMIQSLSDVFSKNWDEFHSLFSEVNDRSMIIKHLPVEEWGQLPLEWLAEICEEIFCDMFGARLFGMGYLYAFEYLTAPGMGKTDLREYSPLDQRAFFLVEAIKDFSKETKCERHVVAASTGDMADEEEWRSWPGLVGFTERFGKEPDPVLDPADRFLLKSAHEACETLMPHLRSKAGEVCDSWGADGAVGVGFPTLDAAKRVARRYAIGLPATAALPDAVNGGWLEYLSGRSHFGFINELVFKSLDVAEFERRISEDATQS